MRLRSGRGSVGLRGGVEMFAIAQHLKALRSLLAHRARHRVNQITEGGVIRGRARGEVCLRRGQIGLLLVADAFLACEVGLDGCHAGPDRDGVQTFGRDGRRIGGDENSQVRHRTVQLIGVNVAHNCFLLRPRPAGVEARAGNRID
jgi:hypothetical protein